MDAAFKSLETYDWRVAQIYPSPRHLVNAPKPWAGTPYHVLHGWLVDMHTVTERSYEAPPYAWSPASRVYPVHRNEGVNYGEVNAQAPTTGVYTGLSASGMGEPF